MNDRIHLLVVDDDPIWRERCRTMFSTHPRIEVAFMASSGRDAVRMAEDSAPDAAIVDHGLVDISGLEVAEKIAKVSPGTQVFIVTDSGSMDLWRKATALGVQQVFTKPYTDADIGPAIEEAVDNYRRALMEHSSRLPLFERGTGPAARFKEIKTVTQLQSVKTTVIMIISPKGGVGKTTMAVNIACAAAAQADLSVRVALVDLNEFGTVNIHLNLGSPEKEFQDGTMSRNILAFQHIQEALSAEELKDYMVRHESGLWVLPSVPSPELIVYVTEDLIAKVIKILRANFDLVILDLPPSINLEVSWAATDMVDYILLVTTPDVQVIRGMAQIRNTLSNLKVEDKCYRIVNKYGMQGGMSLTEMKKYMPYPALGTVKEYPKVQEAIARGVPMVLWEPNGEFASSVRSIINQMFPVFAAEENRRAKSPGILSSLFNRLKEVRL